MPSRDAQRYSWHMTEDPAPQQSDEMVRLQETVDSMKVKPRGLLGASLYSVISDVDDLETNTHYLGGVCRPSARPHRTARTKAGR
jgi:hypothetical protein